jgi:hypothetical protein
VPGVALEHRHDVLGNVAEAGDGEELEVGGGRGVAEAGRQRAKDEKQDAQEDLRSDPQAGAPKV